jgi:microcystin degradation protein MlrC
MFDPSKSLYARLAELEGGSVASLSYTPGFPPADIAECGPAVAAFAWDQAAAEAAARELSAAVAACEGDFKLDIYQVDAAVQRAMANRSGKPVVLADTQDNPGGGANSDTVWLLDALVRHRAEGAVVAMIFDPDTARQAHEAGEGNAFDGRLGARSGLEGHTPYAARYVVEKLADGVFTATGPMWRGARMRLGPMALLRVAEAPGVRVIVSSRKMQAGDQAMLRHLGVEPAEQRILVLKSSVHFRADFQAIAAEVLVVDAPGPNSADPGKLDYRNLRAGVRLNPLGSPSRGPA